MRSPNIVGFEPKIAFPISAGLLSFLCPIAGNTDIFRQFADFWLMVTKV